MSGSTFVVGNIIFDWAKDLDGGNRPEHQLILALSMFPLSRSSAFIKISPNLGLKFDLGRKLDKSGQPITKKGDKHSNIVNGYVQWLTVQLADLKNTKKLFPEYKSIHSQVLQDVIGRVETAFSNFLKPDKNGCFAGKPRFKGLHYYKSFTYSQLKNKHIQDGYVDLPGIGNVEAIFHRPIPTGFIVKLGTVKLEADGWYISLALEDRSIPQEDEEICPTMGNSIAIDVGLERFLTSDDGSFVEIPRFLRKSANRMSRLQHRKSKLPDGSKDQQKLYKTIARLHQKIARQRLNFHFATAYKLFGKADVVFVEDLKLKNLIRRNKPKTALKDTASHKAGKFVPNGQSSSSGMNKSWLDAAHGSFIQILKWVAWKLGKSVVKLNPWGTSQHCSNCLNRVPKTLSDRWHLCDCGTSLNRDHNSAILLKLLGLGLASIQTAPRGKSSKATQLSTTVPC